MEKRLIKVYLILFVMFYAGYSFLNWLLTTKTGIVRMDKLFSNFLIPFIITYLLTFFIFSPIVKKAVVNSKFREIMIWALLPFSISIPTALSQSYFKDASYKVITLEKPEDVFSYPKERFFKFRHFYTSHKHFTVFRKQRTTGRRGRRLKLDHYYIGPMYGGNISGKARVAYGFRFSTSVNRSMLWGKDRSEVIEALDRRSAREFYNTDLRKVGFFEKQVYSHSARTFKDAWHRNPMLDQKAEPFVLVNKNDTFQEHISQRRKVALLSVLISLGITVSVILLTAYVKK